MTTLKKSLCWILAAVLALSCAAALGEAAASVSPVTQTELYTLIDEIKVRALASPLMNDPAAPDAQAEDGYAFQYDFGWVYADRPEMREDTHINAVVLMDRDTPGPRGISVDWSVNQVMDAIPCENVNMYGEYEGALLYLTGDAASGFSYGRVIRDHQRISVMEYGVVDPAAGTRATLTCWISGDGVSSLRIGGASETVTAEFAEGLYRELLELKNEHWYPRAASSVNGAELEVFGEWDLDTPSISYSTAEPTQFGDLVEDVLIDNGDGTWLRRVDGDGFDAVFSCDEKGQNARLISYSIVGTNLEGPRYIRLGDQLEEDLRRFRHGEGKLDEASMTEVLYGTPGTAPYGLIEYGSTDEVTVRYVTTTLDGPVVELYLRYEETILKEMILHTL